MTYGEMCDLFQRSFPKSHVNSMQWTGEARKFVLKGFKADKDDKSCPVIALMHVCYDTGILTDLGNGDIMAFQMRQKTTTEEAFDNLARWGLERNTN